MSNCKHEWEDRCDMDPYVFCPECQTVAEARHLIELEEENRMLWHLVKVSTESRLGMKFSDMEQFKTASRRAYAETVEECS